MDYGVLRQLPSGLHRTPLSRKVVPGTNPICRLCWSMQCVLLYGLGMPATDLSEVADHAVAGDYTWNDAAMKGTVGK